MSKGTAKGYKTLGEANRSLNAVPDDDSTSSMILPKIDNKRNSSNNNEIYNFVNTTKRPPSTKEYLPGINSKGDGVIKTLFKISHIIVAS